VNQLNFGCCFAAALAGVLTAVEYKQRGVILPISIKYIYGNRKDTDTQSEGMIPREGLNMASRFGAPRYDLLPGLSNYPDAQKAITPALDGEGIPNRIRGYVRLTSFQDISDYLSIFGLPVLFCTFLSESFMRTGADGIVPAPAGAMLGGHAMQCVGITGGRYIIQNSWGTMWGEYGFGYLNEADNFSIEAWGVIPESTDTMITRPQTVMLTVGSTTMMVDTTKVVLDVAPVIINGRTMVPLRAISEALKAEVEFYGQADGRHVILLRWGGEKEWQL
jgi:hypothetical protein